MFFLENVKLIVYTETSMNFHCWYRDLICKEAQRSVVFLVKNDESTVNKSWSGMHWWRLCYCMFTTINKHDCSLHTCNTVILHLNPSALTPFHSVSSIDMSVVCYVFTIFTHVNNFHRQVASFCPLKVLFHSIETEILQTDLGKLLTSMSIGQHAAILLLFVFRFLQKSANFAGIVNVNPRSWMYPFEHRMFRLMFFFLVGQI